MDRGIVRRTLNAVVVGQVVGMTVPVAFAVRLVVLVVVRDEIAKGEPVMRRDEVHGRPGFPAPLVELVGRARQPRRHLGHLGLVAPPESSDRIPIAVVPLGPSGREAADLVAARPAIPGLGDQLDG